ncbi:MAG: ketopantoate reductase family protein [Proteobacteria bacterium]|nr:ketopantoate reductase family protein [Pseudomonadota bacterium]MBQ4360927.1 ketopantoate reductase family protein [Pseudomonadota bacterium]
MKVLIYGVGVLGATLLHELCKTGHEVTGVARSQYDQFVNHGVKIRHYYQRKTTIDHPHIVKSVASDDHFDIVFSVMQATQQKGVLDALAAVDTSTVVLVGNNLESEEMEQYILEHAVSPRSVLFGFQDSGGHRKDDMFVVGRLPVTLFNVGKLHGSVDHKDIKLLSDLFGHTSFKLRWISDMYGYYWCHIAEIMPYAYMCYGMNYELKKMTGKDVKKIIQASREAFSFLAESGITVMPPKENDCYMPGIKCKLMSALYWIMAKTSLGEIFIAGHCRYAPAEMKYIDIKFDEFRKNHGNKEMPVWDELRNGFLCHLN